MRVRSLFFPIIACGSIMVACAPDPPAPKQSNTATVAGTVGAATLTPVSAVADLFALFPPNNQPAVPALRIRFSDKANTCDATHFASSTFLEVHLNIAGGAQVGTFPIEPAGSTLAVGQAEAVFTSFDGTCNSTVSETATSGTLTIKGGTFANASALFTTGSVDITFAGGHITGDFDAVFCDRGAAATDATGGPDASGFTCAP